MNFVKFARIAVVAAFVTMSGLGQPTAALADDVIVDGKIITAENAAASDPEWKYVPVRRLAATSNGEDTSAASHFDGRLLTADDLTRE
ncbi:MAG: hypothetical protein KF893_16560 [Caldilineaceae bacterium]|nr:hypothetical protein [Caldilineaceae bacterium]